MFNAVYIEGAVEHDSFKSRHNSYYFSLDQPTCFCIKIHKTTAKKILGSCHSNLISKMSRNVLLWM